jgi:hypothetical protein
VSDGGETVNNAENVAARRLPFLRRLGTVIPISVLACLSFGSVDPASAENRSLADRYTAEHTAGRLDNDAKDKDATSDPLRSGPLFAVVSIADQRISVYGSGGLIVRAPVSTGMRGHATPTGVFSIVQKRRWHESNIYSSAPMPFMQRITWSGIALHAGVVPGHPASHGCIRLPASFAQRLFGATEVGQRVIIAPSDTSPIEITHANLPAPKLWPAPSLDVSNVLDAPVSIAQQSDGAGLKSASLDDAPAGLGRLNPIEFARAMKSEANSNAKAADRATKAAMLLIDKKTTELRMAARKLAGAENAAEDAAGEVAAAVRRLEKTDGKEAIAEAAEAQSEAEAALVEAQKVREARLAKASEAQTQAEAALTEAQKAAEEARAANATEARNEAATPLMEAQKVEQPRGAEAAEAKNETQAALIETQNAQELPMAKPSEAKNEARAVLREAQRAAELRLAKATKAMDEARAALIEVQKAGELRVGAATEEKNEAEAALIEAQKAEETRIAKGTEAKDGAQAVLIEAQKAVEQTRVEKEVKEQELAGARSAAVDAKAAGKAAAQALAEARRRVKPLSVFISRKTGRLYVRQDFEPLFDVPVSIRDADREIGTHVYVSTRAAEDGSALHWQAVTIPVMAESASARRDGKRRRDAQDSTSTSAVPASVPEPETAHGALERVTIPEETSQRLAELAWVGASVIISDHGISGETGATTDFIILTKSRTSTR